MIDRETFISGGMESIRKAIVDAPSHLEIEAGFEALLHHLVGPSEGEGDDRKPEMGGNSGAEQKAPDAHEAQTTETMKPAEDMAQDNAESKATT